MQYDESADISLRSPNRGGTAPWDWQTWKVIQPVNVFLCLPSHDTSAAQLRPSEIAAKTPKRRLGDIPIYVRALHAMIWETYRVQTKKQLTTAGNGFQISYGSRNMMKVPTQVWEIWSSCPSRGFLGIMLVVVVKTPVDWPENLPYFKNEATFQVALCSDSQAALHYLILILMPVSDASYKCCQCSFLTDALLARDFFLHSSWLIYKIYTATSR